MFFSRTKNFFESASGQKGGTMSKKLALISTTAMPDSSLVQLEIADLGILELNLSKPLHERFYAAIVQDNGIEFETYAQNLITVMFTLKS